MKHRLYTLACAAALLWPTALLVRAERRDDGLALAIVAAHEAGIDASADEVAAIAAVLRERCRGCSLHTAARRVSPRIFSGATSRPFYGRLSRSGVEPRGWPSSASWPLFRPSWLSLLAVADEVAAGNVRARCAPEAWGGDIDRARVARLRLVRIDCGHTRNDFYVYPRRGER